MSKNDITGDEIKSKPSTEKYRENYDKIFGNKKYNISSEEQCEENDSEIEIVP
jgi:hypothetical protein